MSGGHGATLRAARVVSRTGRGVAAALGSLVLAACAGLPGPAPSGGTTLTGRLAVRVDGHDGQPPRAENAAFELRGDARDGQLDLSTPLGSVIARARWSPDTVTLATPQGRSDYPDLDALTRDVLGESVPVAALFDWLRGRPWPGASASASSASASTEPKPAAGSTEFMQLGWTVDLARLDDGWVVARRIAAPVVTVRAHLDRP